jgi:elongation factor P
MITATQLRAGVNFKLENKPYQVLRYKHSVTGRGQATIRVKVENLRTGEVREKAFNSSARVEELTTTMRSLQYLYGGQEQLHFMDPRTFKQFSLTKKIFGKKAKFLKEGGEVKVLFGILDAKRGEEALSFELPNSIVLEVTEASPGVRGDTVSGATKSVTLENDLVVQVPLFIRRGNKIKVDTRSGEYISRVN